ncbi:hypothetical protein KKG90_08735, partial [Candidatus Bipolaricaulota bacterium]|nr:hypothetical protein [Candidatus Bipolaricaulota bacterium]
ASNSNEHAGGFTSCVLALTKNQKNGYGPADQPPTWRCVNVIIYRKSAAFVCLSMLALISVLALGAAATEATVLTNLGGVADGTLAGIGPIISLRAPDEVTIIGPMQQYDLPLSSIRQISLDFPRLVIETETGVVIGPYSAFSGIDELLKFTPNSGKETIGIPFTSVRAIAFHGRGLRAVPREWMGDHFLSTPEIVAASPLIADRCDNCSVTVPAQTNGSSLVDTTPIWNTITPEVPIEEPAEFPWWLGVLGVGALVIIFYFLSSGSAAN